MESNQLYTADQIREAIWKELKESEYTGDNNDRAYEVIGIVMAGIEKIKGSAAGREEDAALLLRWLNENDWSGVGSGEYINHTNGRIISEAKLYQEFKQGSK